MVTYWDGWNQYYFDYIKGWTPVPRRREHTTQR